MSNYIYPARIEPDDGGFAITFYNFPEANSGGKSKRKAIKNASEALELVVLTYSKQGRPLPTPTAINKLKEPSYVISIPLPAITSAKIALIEAFNESNLTKVAFAKQLGKGESEIRRMLDPYHKTKLASIEAGLFALGKKLVISVEAA